MPGVFGGRLHKTIGFIDEAFLLPTTSCSIALGPVRRNSRQTASVNVRQIDIFDTLIVLIVLFLIITPFTVQLSPGVLGEILQKVVQCSRSTTFYNTHLPPQPSSTWGHIKTWRQHRTESVNPENVTAAKFQNFS